MARAGALGREQLAERYAELHARALASAPTPGRHQDVLERLAGHVKDKVSRADRPAPGGDRGLHGGVVPLAVPLRPLGGHLRAAGAAWAAAQTYLDPAPTDLTLRSRL